MCFGRAYNESEVLESKRYKREPKEQEACWGKALFEELYSIVQSIVFIHMEDTHTCSHACKTYGLNTNTSSYSNTLRYKGKKNRKTKRNEERNTWLGWT